MKDAITEDKLTEDNSLAIEAIEYYRKKYDVDIIDSDLKSQYGRYMNNLINSAHQDN